MTDGQPLPPPAPPAPDQQQREMPEQEKQQQDMPEQQHQQQDMPEQQQQHQEIAQQPAPQPPPEPESEQVQQPEPEPVQQEQPRDEQELVATRETPVHDSVDRQEPAAEEREDADGPDADGERIISRDGATTFSRRWQDIELAFVDEPRHSVRDADALVQDVVREITEVFGREREHLEGQWDRGDQVSTEDLRVALQRYRDFFQRLLAT